MSKQSDIPYSERELIQRALTAAKPNYGELDMPYWILAKRLFMTGRTVSMAICTHYGFDPNQEVSAPYLHDDD